jgi:glycerophosphoryl diester phosphodiesterase
MWVENDRPNTLVIGHRGDRATGFAENTMPAFESAMANVDGFETDLHLTSDGVLILIHDDVCIHQISHTPPSFHCLTIIINISFLLSG